MGRHRSLNSILEIRIINWNTHTPLNTMYLQDSNSNESNALALLETAVGSPAEAMVENPELQEAFDESLRSLAEDIIEFHPSLAHILVGMAEVPSPVIHGQN